MQGKELPPSVRNGNGLRNDRFTEIAAADGFIYRFHQHGKSGAWLGDSFRLPPTLWMIFASSEACIQKPSIMIRRSLFSNRQSTAGRPAMGSWLSYGLGSENKNLPAFCVLLSRGPGDIQPLASRNWGNGFLDSIHQGVHLQSGKDPVLYLQNPPGTDKQSRGKMLEHIASLNRIQEEEFGDPEITTRIAQYEMAYRMQTSVPEVMNFSDEPEALLNYMVPIPCNPARLPRTAFWQGACPSEAFGSFNFIIWGGMRIKIYRTGPVTLQKVSIRLRLP